MEIIERRIIKQDWYETEYAKTGWDSHGWFFIDSENIPNDMWNIVEYIDFDKFNNPISAIAEKITILD